MSSDSRDSVEPTVPDFGPFLDAHPGCDGIRALTAHPKMGSSLAAAGLCVVSEERVDSEPSRAFALGFLARRTSPRPIDTATAHSLQARSAVKLGAHACADRHYACAIRGLEALGRLSDAASLSLRRSYSLTSLGHYEQARSATLAALEYFKALDDVPGQAHAHFELGGMAYRLDQYRDALEHFRDCRRLSPRFPGLEQNSSLFGNIANCLVALSRFRAADRNFDRALDLARQQGLERLIPFLESNRAYGLAAQGRFTDALMWYERSLQSAREHQNRDLLGGILVDLAELHLQLGMTHQARKRATEALAVLPPNQLDKERAQARLHLAIAWMVENRPARADQATRDARDHFLDEGNSVWAARCDLLLARLAMTAGQFEAARTLAISARDVFERFGRGVRAGRAELAIAEAEIASGSFAEALRRIETLRVRMKDLETPWLDVELHRQQALTLQHLGCGAEAQRSFAAAVEVLEAHRGRVPADEFMVSFLQTQAALYAEAVANALDLGDAEGAFQYVERSRSRALVDLLSSREGSSVSDSTRKSGWLRDQRLVRLRQELSAVNKRIHKATLDGVASGDADLKRHIERRGQLEEQVAERVHAAQLSDPEFVSLASVESPSLDEIQACLDGRTTIVEYFLGAEFVTAFVIRADGLRAFALPAPVQELARRVQKFKFHMSHAMASVGPDEAMYEVRHQAARANLARLYEMLLAPLQSALVDCRLVIAPHGVLHNVPFHAFPVGDGWASDTYDFSYAPSAAVFLHCSRKPSRATGQTAVYAVPDAFAPSIAAEANAVERALSPNVLVRREEAATWDALRTDAKTARILHVATHAQLNLRAPMLSAIRLHDRWADLYDLYDLDVRSDLVVLSACESGAARITAGDELLGLIRGWLFAGAQRLLLAQWRIDDKAAAVFMHTFHVGVGAGRPYQCALREAMAAVRDRYPHPYYWAPFFMVGQPQ